MSTRSGSARALILAAVLAAVPLGLAGCSGVDGVEFNGKIFEAVGLSGDQFSKRSEPKTQPRAPLVLPPDPSKLPEPGSAPTPVVADQQWPKDRDAQRLADAEARKQAQQKHCQDGNWKQKAHKDDIGAAQGPHGSCTGSIFSVIGGTLFGSGE